jgi:hypothetical protein
MYSTTLRTHRKFNLLAQAMNKKSLFLPFTNIPKFNIAKYYHPYQIMSVDKHEYHYIPKFNLAKYYHSSQTISVDKHEREPLHTKVQHSQILPPISNHKRR